MDRELLPRGATRKDDEIGKFFAIRRQWQASELRFLENESAPYEDRKLLCTWGEQRSELEAQYLEKLKEVRQRFSDPEYDPDQPLLAVSHLRIRSMVQALSAEDDTALVEYYVT